MLNNSQNQLSEKGFSIDSLVEKLKQMSVEWASKESIIAILRGGISYVEQWGLWEKDFEKFLLNSDVYAKAAELPWIKDNLSNALSAVTENLTFFQAKNEFNRHMRGDRILKAKPFLLKMGEVAQSDREKREVEEIQSSFTEKFNKARSNYEKWGDFAVNITEMKNYARNDEQKATIEGIVSSLKNEAYKKNTD